MLLIEGPSVRTYAMYIPRLAFVLMSVYSIIVGLKMVKNGVVELKMVWGGGGLKKIKKDPSCSCGDFESVYHLFFQCPNYADIRTRYLPNNLKDLNTNQLLCGMPNATVTDNETLSVKCRNS